MYDSERCLKCVYSAKVNEGIACCIYILIKHERRGCYGSGKCEKFEKMTKKKRCRIMKDGGFIYDNESY